MAKVVIRSERSRKIMSAVCDICGKEFKNTQGRRGHKTFVHGLHGNRGKPMVVLAHNQSVDETSSLVEHENNSISDYRDMLNKLKSEVVRNTELLTELRRTVPVIQDQLALKVASSAANDIATKVRLISKSVEKHEDWLNPKYIDDFVLSFCGRSIAHLEGRIENLSSSRQIKDSG